jgi:hypothetical protein
VPPESHYVDFGTPVRVDASGSSHDQDCSTYLAKSASDPKYAKVAVPIVDLGQRSRNGPDCYNGYLRQVVTSGIEMSAHAENVLSILLKRLEKNGILGDTTVSCAFVCPAPTMVVAGKSWSDQANSVEMLDAVQALVPHLDTDGIPAAVNMSLGTQVGPHNGESPLKSTSWANWLNHMSVSSLWLLAMTEAAGDQRSRRGRHRTNLGGHRGVQPPITAPVLAAVRP